VARRNGFSPPAHLVQRVSKTVALPLEAGHIGFCQDAKYYWVCVQKLGNSWWEFVKG
jgi:succinate dehydrogenase hydrophobic anchor subunit